ncbi:SET and MYND domain-containing protein 4 [Pectinophora gossypiella]|uniref:SET and MYND domain-containing protein 4 n=1 Tax=Pectinophora gossypiella TaxID=13191 RepID=UPI00214F386B|nr:SET and MYND domain-containing protein 4 [Pectinophora gossypiella]
MSRVYETEDAAYATACSEGTLAGPRGFFRALAEEAAARAEGSAGWLDRLPTLDGAARLQAVIDHPEVMGVLSEALSRVCPLRRGKDARASQQRREGARAALAAGDHARALALASQAVLKAPPTGSEEALDGGVSLALALWQRSEALLAAGHARAALADLRLALRERLPARMRPLYYWRMGHCYKGAGEPTRAKVSYELAGRLLGGDEEARAQLARDIDSLDFNAQPPPAVDRTGISVTGGARQNMPALSKLVKITEEENRGRFAVAGARVRTGDVLLVDAPYAACLHQDYYGTHCTHCFKRLDQWSEEAPVWCPACSAVAFCGLSCREAALGSYHPHECSFLDLFIGSGMSILSHIALRMVTQAGLETTLSIHSKYISNDIKTVEGTVLNDIEGVTKKSKMKNRKERLNRSKKGLKMNEKNSNEEELDGKGEDKVNLVENLELKASQIYSLCTHTDQRSGEDCLKRIVMGMFLTECLKKSGYFQSCDPDNLEKAERAVCETLVRNLQLLQFNAHEIYETLRGAHAFSGSKPLYIAVGIYPTGALFNHECYPAVARYFEGTKLVLRASRPLEPGDVVSENYGPHFLVRGLQERRRALASRYWFHCDCRACREDWPALKQMAADDPPYLRCLNTSCTWKFKAHLKSLPTKCSKCSTNVDKDLVKINLEAVEECISSFQEGARLMEEERGEEATRVLCAALDRALGCAGAAPPLRAAHVAQEALRSCFAADGNVHTVTGDRAPTPDTTLT